MTKIVSISMAAALMAVTLSASSAFADKREGEEGMKYRERQSCSWVRKCHREDGRRICEKVKVCRDRH